MKIIEVKKKIEEQCRFPVRWEHQHTEIEGWLTEGPFKDLIRIFVKQVLNGDYEVVFEAQVPMIHPFKAVSFYEGEGGGGNGFIKTGKKSARRRKGNK